MKDKDKTKAQLIKELGTLRQEIDKLKEAETKHEQADEDFRENETRLRTVIESIPFDIFVIDATGHYILQNSACQKNWGDFIGKRPEDVAKDQETLTLWQSNNRRAFAGEVVRGEVHFRIKDEEKDFYNIIAPIKNHDKIYGILGINIDISERKKADAKLLEEKKYSEAIINSIPEIFYLIDENGHILKWNQNAEIVTGYSAEEISKMGPLDFFIDRDKRLVEKAIHEVYIKGKTSTEAHFLSKDGKEILYLFNAKLLALGNQNYLIGTGVDITERKKAEERIRFLAEILNASPISVVASDKHGNIVYVNPATEKLFGYKSDELLGKNLIIFNVDPKAEIIQKDIINTIKRGDVWKGEILNRKKNGYVFSIDASVYRLLDKEGNFIADVGFQEDVTKHKRMEEQLMQSENKYKYLSGLTSDYVYSCTRTKDTPYRVDWIGGAFEAITGYTPEELLQLSCWSFFVHPEDKSKVDQYLSKTDPGQYSSCEFRIVTKDKGICWIKDYSRCEIDRNRPTWYCLYGASQDITERKLAEESLKQLIHQHQLILDAAGEGLAGLNLEGKITFANPFVIKTTGYKIEELIGQDLHEIFHYKKPDGTPYPPEECPINETLKKGITKNIRDEVFFRKDGTSFPVRYTSTPIIEDGVIKGAVVTFRDITERKRLEEQFLQAQKMEAVGQLAGGVAHDFNNILTAIIGYGNLLQMKLKKDDPFQAYVNQILISSEKAANLTHSLLAFSRKQIINPKPVNLNDIVRSVEKLLLRVIGEDIELQTKFADKDLVVMADSGQIEQVLMNLATNSRDAMPDGGLLIIRTEIVELDKGYIKTHSNSKPGKYALISVIDTGKGIDEKTKELIFEPFFTTKERGRGTGLGLAVVYGIVKQHNGNIAVHSELDKGTTFKIYLPIIEAEVKETELKVITTPIGGKETILIAEDNIDVRNFIKTVLEQFNYKVIEAVNGEDAINKFMENKNRIEFLILDVIMPKKNGKEAYETIKKVRPDIKALFLSGYTENIIHRKGMLEEGLNFVLKPISPQKLLKKTREVLDT